MDSLLKARLATGIVLFLISVAFIIGMTIYTYTQFGGRLWVLIIPIATLAYLGRALYYWVFDFKKFEDIVDFGDPISLNVRGRYP